MELCHRLWFRGGDGARTVYPARWGDVLVVDLTAPRYDHWEPRKLQAGRDKELTQNTELNPGCAAGARNGGWKRESFQEAWE